MAERASRTQRSRRSSLAWLAFSSTKISTTRPSSSSSPTFPCLVRTDTLRASAPRGGLRQLQAEAPHRGPSHEEQELTAGTAREDRRLRRLGLRRRRARRHSAARKSGPTSTSIRPSRDVSRWRRGRQVDRGHVGHGDVSASPEGLRPARPSRKSPALRRHKVRELAMDLATPEARRDPFRRGHQPLLPRHPAQPRVLLS